LRTYPFVVKIVYPRSGRAPAQPGKKSLGLFRRPLKEQLDAAVAGIPYPAGKTEPAAFMIG
jgi:hypothetical protein